MTTTPPFAATRALAELLGRLSSPAEPTGPPPSLEALRPHRDDVLAIAALHGGTNVRVVGSVARGAASPSSDLDLLVRFAAETSLACLGQLNSDLEHLLGCVVDVIPELQRLPPSPESRREAALRERLDAEAIEL